VTIFPALLIFTMQVGMAGWGWLSQRWYLGFGVFFGFALWIVLVSLVALACSAYVKWRLVAGALVFGFFLILAGASQIINNILRVEWGSLLNPSWAMQQVWRWLLWSEPMDGPSPETCAVILIGLAVVLIAVLERKLRPVEVIK
jgi:hypothetical protein